MQVKIHRGVNQIGGCVTEIRSQKARVFVDVGSNLPNCENEIEVNIANISKKCDAVLITHYHGDHIGEYMQVSKNVPIYIGKQAKEIFTIFQNKMKDTGVTEITQEHIDKIDTFKIFKQGVPFKIGDMKITPIRTDHSAFDSYMFLIEANGKRILHTRRFPFAWSYGKRNT